ncbi:MAG TPA: glycosyltransferase [Opitutaceae bacterium]|nr:glycosyltransferase [Opitutaceae bacterium]
MPESARPLRRLLIISPHWPPLNAPDMQRARMSLPFYRACGWEPIVLAVGERWQDGVREPELTQTVPDDVAVHFTPALPLRWTRFFGVRNIGLRAWLHLFKAGSRLIREKKVDLVFFTNTQFVTFPMGRIWRFLHGVPYVVDLQDPWRTDYYERPGSRRPPGGWKYQLARFMAWVLEGWSFRRADGLMSVSPSYIDDLRARYPWFREVPSEVILFGASRSDLVAAQRLPPPAHRYRREKNELHFLYTGAAGPVMPHALTVLCDGLRLYRDRFPERARRLRFHFLGTSYVAPGQGRNSVMPIAEKCGVADQVEEIPHRLGHLECLRLQCDADVLMLPGSSDLAYSPSKIYPYYLAGRPIVALVFKNSVLERLLERLNCAVVVRFQENESKDEAHENLIRFFDQALLNFPPGTLPVRNEPFFNQNFLADDLTRQQCNLFDRALAHHTS